MTYVDLSLLRRIFTRTTLRKLLVEGYSCAFQEMSASICMETECITNLQKISDMYSLMCRKYRGEYFYKNTLFNRLLLGVHSLRTTTALTEIPVARSKADFILINGRAVVYEIKSELDNYERLNNQIDDYYKAFCYVVVVVGKGQETIAEGKIRRPYVGIMTVDKKGHCSEFRTPGYHSSDLELWVIFNILRKGEFEKIIMANYFIAGVGRALLFKGEELFADCRTLADSSITIGVTAEDIH